MDEPGISKVPNHVPRVISPKGTKCVCKVMSGNSANSTCCVLYKCHRHLCSASHDFCKETHEAKCFRRHIGNDIRHWFHEYWTFCTFQEFCESNRRGSSAPHTITLQYSNSSVSQATFNNPSFFATICKPQTSAFGCWLKTKLRKLICGWWNIQTLKLPRLMSTGSLDQSMREWQTWERLSYRR